MPVKGQQSIVDAVQLREKGIVMTEFTILNAQSGGWKVLSTILLGEVIIGPAEDALMFNITTPGHPLWSGLPASFTTSKPMFYSWLAAFPFGKIQLISTIDLDDLGASAGVIARADEDVGRIVQLAHAAHYAPGFDWNDDENITRMMINAIRWVAKLI
ncbi:unnamed protein product [Didymodactylos carnosus]|uniref:Uncharacterized protein n=1 Tax=Didymodactylos carnosus TaxID=1234261 RepID=A0A815JS30_9BILA|nr:unnamed protein product [Didymodactylos carnosus]CAF1638078.1 unnamed protein product [Didymodactylos carnosus]CAF4278759.1 unnamed protein product [Didymodactylos carnosus]CAF4471421.1 unnamed protein product [Didymodactylos carnosus]